MSTIKKGILTNDGEWRKHLRPEGRHMFWRGEREAEKREIKKQVQEELWDADPNCQHELDPHCMSGVRCLKCGGWYCL